MMLPRRAFLRLGLASAAGTAAAPLANLAPKVDPILKAIVDKGGRVVARPDWPAESLWSAEVWLENSVVGFIDKANGMVQLCTRTWPTR